MPTALTRWDPFADFAAMRALADRVFDQGLRLSPFRNGEDLATVSLGLDVYETGDEYVIRAAVPGVPPENVEIAIDDDVLTIRGESTDTSDAAEGDFLRRELRYGRFERQLRLPPTVDAAAAKATFEHGILRLALPKRPEARKRTLKITPNGVIEEPKGS